MTGTVRAMNSGMHLGIICNEFPPFPHGGIGSSNFDLAHGLIQAGHQVTVVGVYDGLLKEEITVTSDGQLKIVRLPSVSIRWGYRGRALLNRWRLRRWLIREHSRHPFDLIEFSDYEGWLPWGGPPQTVTVARLQGTNALFCSELGENGNAFEHALERRGLLRAGCWIGLSRYVFAGTLEICGRNTYPGRIIYHAVDTDFFTPDPSVLTEKGLVLFVNSLRPRKGVEQLVEAANLFLPDRPHAKLVMVGSASGDVETYIARLKERVRPELRARVIFAGRLDRNTGVLPYLRRAEVCCYPSHVETFGIAPVEAMSVGKATVYSKNGPGPEVIEDGVSGLLCNPCNPADIADKIGMLLDRPQWASALGAAGRRRAVSLFGRKDWIEKNLRCFEDCILGRTGHQTL